MVDNFQDKGYLWVQVKQQENEWHLCEIGFKEDPDAKSFYVDYENGNIYINTDNGEKNIIGYYVPCTSGPYEADVYDRTKSRIIGRVGGEVILFRAREADHSVGRYMPDEACLAWYSKAGRITPHGHQLTDIGLINGSKIGGAAAFVAVFFSFNFKSMYCDYFDMDKASFDAKYDSFLNYMPDVTIPVSDVVRIHMETGVKTIPNYKTSNTATEQLQMALKLSLELSNPTAADLTDRREIYRYLGFVTYLQGSSEEAYTHYRNGLPISESNDERVLYGYLEMLSKMRDKNAAAYGKEFCNAVEDIYHNAFEKLTDMNHKASIMKWAVREKCGVYKTPRDIAGAEKINALVLQAAIKQEQGSLTCQYNLRQLHKDNLDRINAGKRLDRYSDISDSYQNTKKSETVPKSFFRKIFPLSFGTNSWAGVIGRILLYLLADLIVGVVAGFVPVLGVLIGIIAEIYVIAGCIVTVLSHLGKID